MMIIFPRLPFNRLRQLNPIFQTPPRRVDVEATCKPQSWGAPSCCANKSRTCSAVLSFLVRSGVFLFCQPHTTHIYDLSKGKVRQPRARRSRPHLDYNQQYILLTNWVFNHRVSRTTHLFARPSLCLQGDFISPMILQSVGLR